VLVGESGEVAGVKKFKIQSKTAPIDDIQQTMQRPAETTTAEVILD